MSTESAPHTVRAVPTSPSELQETPIRPGDLAVSTTGDSWYYVVERPDTPAGEFEISPSGTLAEWSDCDESAAVVVAVDVDEARSTPGVEGVEDIPTAVAHGRLHTRALAENEIVVALDEFVDARRRGEWSGLDDYLRGVSR